MKYLFLSIAFLSLPSFACTNMLPESEVIRAINLEAGAGSVSCGSLPMEKCHCFEGIVWEAAELVDNVVLDYVAKLETESCLDIAECDLKFISKICAEGVSINNYDLLEVYCAKDIMKVDGKKLVENPVKKAAYESAQAAKAQLAAAMAIAKKSQLCGQDTLALMLVRNASKGLSNAQKIQLVESTDLISKLLQLGSLDAAKAEIQAATADGVIITESDKTALAAYIDGCKP